ncbi:rod shape-determining protein MreC [Nonomuraea solani]|uniref:Cell shape-determining protein MreC n=1 Tax=Nonomuraea solani TaxID=1144553 RepID=A0A1H6E0Q2_9ACTN|nr:rod shape-determining protein MreC [Nonomuraea solani]SEG91001.1 rod shape-determining protein MreC [Nonomuraea solani]
MRRAFVLLVLATAVLLVVVDRTVAPLEPLREAGATVYGTAQAAAGAVTRSFGGEGRLRALEQENARLRADLTASGTRGLGTDAGTALGTALGTRTAGGATTGPARHRGVAAHVVGFGAGQRLTIDAGSAAGVVRDVTVLNADGLIGKVTWAGAATASVSLITDPASSVGARMAGSGELGVVTGLPGETRLRLSLFDPHAPLKVGDQVVTLGSAGARPYVAGVPIGTVAAIESVPGAATRTALVRPAARLSALGLVAVIVPRSGR